MAVDSPHGPAEPTLAWAQRRMATMRKTVFACWAVARLGAVLWITASACARHARPTESQAQVEFLKEDGGRLGRYPGEYAAHRLPEIDDDVISYQFSDGGRAASQK